LKSETKNNETFIKGSRKKNKNHKNKHQIKHNKKNEYIEFFNVFFYTKITLKCKLKNLCTHLIKQPNNYYVKQWKKISSKIKLNKIEKNKKRMKIKILISQYR